MPRALWCVLPWLSLAAVFADGDYRCTAGYFHQIANVVRSEANFIGSVKVKNVISKMSCLLLCNANATCQSVYYDVSAQVCYLNIGSFSPTPSDIYTGLAYAGVTNRCDNSNQCSLTPLCTGLAKTRSVYTGCVDAMTKGNSESGPYYVSPDGTSPFLIWCDFASDGAWAVFQRRLTGLVDFYKGWNEYKNGFGDIQGDYWLGGDLIHRLTTAESTKMSIYMENSDGYSMTANYSFMKVQNETNFYMLSLGTYTGDADSVMDFKDVEMSSNVKFTTYDKDNDESPENCAVQYHGAWWYKRCTEPNVNGTSTNATSSNGTYANSRSSTSDASAGDAITEGSSTSAGTLGSAGTFGAPVNSTEDAHSTSSAADSEAVSGLASSTAGPIVTVRSSVAYGMNWFKLNSFNYYAKSSVMRVQV